MCGAKRGGPSTDGLSLTTEAVVQGIVLRGEEPVSNAYVRLLERVIEKPPVPSSPRSAPVPYGVPNTTCASC